MWGRLYKAPPQREGRRHAHPGIKTCPPTYVAVYTTRRRIMKSWPAAARVIAVAESEAYACPTAPGECGASSVARGCVALRATVAAPVYGPRPSGSRDDAESQRAARSGRSVTRLDVRRSVL